MKRLTVFIFIVLMMLPLMLASAQEGSFPEDTFGAVVQTARSGSFDDNGDGTYTLTLNGVREFATIFFATPSVVTARYDTTSLLNDWSAREEGEEQLFGQAVLELENMSVNMDVTATDYDAGVFTYSAIITDIITDAKDDELPDTFEEAALFVIVDKDLADGLQAGRTYFRENHREVTTSTCWLPNCPGDPEGICSVESESYDPETETCACEEATETETEEAETVEVGEVCEETEESSED
jgi:hypothetical protein